MGNRVNSIGGIFQGDSLSPLLLVLCMSPLTLTLRKSTAGYNLAKEFQVNHFLFMDNLKLYGKSEDQIDSLVQTVQLLSEDIGRGFGLKNCGVLLMKRKKKVRSDGIAFLGGRLMREIEEDGLKYLGILEVDMTRGREISETTDESWSWLRKADLSEDSKRSTDLRRPRTSSWRATQQKKSLPNIYIKRRLRLETSEGLITCKNDLCSFPACHSLPTPLPPPPPPPPPLLRSLGSYYDLASSYASIVRMHRTTWTAKRCDLRRPIVCIL